MIDLESIEAFVHSDGIRTYYDMLKGFEICGCINIFLKLIGYIECPWIVVLIPFYPTLILMCYLAYRFTK